GVGVLRTEGPPEQDAQAELDEPPVPVLDSEQRQRGVEERALLEYPVAQLRLERPPVDLAAVLADHRAGRQHLDATQVRLEGDDAVVPARHDRHVRVGRVGEPLDDPRQQAVPPEEQQVSRLQLLAQILIALPRVRPGRERYFPARVVLAGGVSAWSRGVGAHGLLRYRNSDAAG